MALESLNAAFPGLGAAWPASDYKASLTKTMTSEIAAPLMVGMDHPAFRFLGPPVSMLSNTFWTNSGMCPRSGGPFKLSFISDAQTVEFLMSGGNQSAELLVDGRTIELAGSGRISTDASGSPYTLTIRWLEPRKRKYEVAGINLLLRGVNFSTDASIWYPDEDDARPLLLVVGDSLALGVGADSYGRSAPALMARALGFECWSDGLGEAGWTSTSPGEDVVARLEAGAFAVEARDGSGRKRRRLSPPVIATFLGMNDSSAESATITSAWTHAYNRIRTHYGSDAVPLITFGPWVVGDGGEDLHAVDRALRAAVEAARIEGDDRVAFFSLTGGTRSRSSSEVLFEDGSHPSALGHELIGTTAAGRAQRFIHDALPAARLCLPDRASDRVRPTLCLLLTPERETASFAARTAIATGRNLVFDPWSALELVEKLEGDGGASDAGPIFHAADAMAFRTFHSNLGAAWLRLRVRIIVPTTQAFVTSLADPAKAEHAEVVEDLNVLKAAGVPVSWVLIGPQEDGGELARALEAVAALEASGAPPRAATFGACDIDSAARGIAAALPLFQAQFRPQDMCADDCMMTGETFSRIACEAGFQSHLWGPLTRRMPVARTGRGALYLAYGAKYYRIAEHSAASLKRHNPDLQVAIVTNELEQSAVFDFQISAPGAERVIEEYFRPTSRMESMKFIAFPFSPFSETLFLDCDTLITGEITDIFDLFPSEDIVLTNESRVALGADGLPIQKTLELTDPLSYNAGVFLFRNTLAAERYLTAWWAWFLWDQAGPSRRIGNWGHTGVSDQSVLHLIAWADLHAKLGVKLSFAPNVVYNATDRIWALLHQTGRWSEAKVLHSKLPYFLRNTKSVEALWAEEWPKSWL